MLILPHPRHMDALGTWEQPKQHAMTLKSLLDIPGLDTSLSGKFCSILLCLETEISESCAQEGTCVNIAEVKEPSFTA